MKGGGWDWEPSPTSAGLACLPSWEGAQEGLSAHVQPLAPTTSGAVGQ